VTRSRSQEAKEKGGDSRSRRRTEETNRKVKALGGSAFPGHQVGGGEELLHWKTQRRGEGKRNQEVSSKKKKTNIGPKKGPEKGQTNHPKDWQISQKERNRRNRHPKMGEKK